MATLLAYRQKIARELGAFVASTTFAGGAGPSVASSTSQLVDKSALIKSSTQSATFFDDWYILRPSAALASDKVRYVASYDPTQGIIYPDLNWTNAPGFSEAYELHGFIEPLTAMTDIINEALKRCYVTFETTITPVALQTRHAIVGNWIDAEWKVRSVGMLAAGEDRMQTNPYLRAIRGWVSNEGRGTFYINHPGFSFNTTDTIYLWTVSSGYYQCNAGTQTGLSLDTDTSLPSVEWLAPGALIEAFNRFANILDKGSNQRMQQDRSEYATRFTAQCRANFQRPELTFLPLAPFGPLPMGSPYPRSS